MTRVVSDMAVLSGFFVRRCRGLCQFANSPLILLQTAKGADDLQGAELGKGSTARIFVSSMGNPFIVIFVEQGLDAASLLPY